MFFRFFVFFFFFFFLQFRSALHLSLSLLVIMASTDASASAAAASSANEIHVEEVYDACSEVLQDGKNRLARNMVSRNALADVLRDQSVATSYTFVPCL